MISFQVTLKPGEPIYEQVVFAVKKAIVSGQLRPGDPFPSVREMSRELRINPNTAQKVLAQLVNDKMLQIKPGIGSVVAGISEGSQEQRRDLLQSEVERLVVEAKRLSVTQQDLLNAVRQQWDRDKTKDKK